MSVAKAGRNDVLRLAEARVRGCAFAVGPERNMNPWRMHILMGLCVLAAAGLATRQAMLIYRAEVPVTDAEKQRAEELAALREGQLITMALDARNFHPSSCLYQ